jgi:hypothetical protein
MDYLWFILMIAALAGAWILVNRFDKRAKERSRREAYRVLDLENPTEQEVKEALRGLSLYGGRLRKDKEFSELKNRLARKFRPDRNILFPDENSQ